MSEAKKGHAAGIVTMVVAAPVVILLVLVLMVATLFSPAASCSGASGGGTTSSVAAVDSATYQAPEHSDDAVSEAISTFVESVALDDSHGYSQASRTGEPDYDCSSLVWYAVKNAGVGLPGSWPFSTFTMGSTLQAAGFQHLTWSGNPKNAASELKRGDIVVNSARHTETYLGGGLFGGARHAMGGGKEDGHPGDQGGSLSKGEIGISASISSGMTQVYRHDPNAAATGQAASPEATVSVTSCSTQDSGDTGTVDASYQGDGTHAGPAQAKAIAKQLIPQYFPGSDTDAEFSCLVDLWTKESGWRWNADNPSSDAYGIPQALPGSKMASAGSDWKDNAGTQIKWGMGYIKGRADYGTPCKALQMWNSRSPHWY